LLYVSILSFKASLSAAEQQAALGRRATYQFPDGYRAVAEYFLAGPTQVINVGEAETFEPLFKLILDWQDVFDIAVYPAVTAEEGLQIGARLMGAGK